MRRVGRRGRNRYVARMASNRTAPARNAAGAKKPTPIGRLHQDACRAEGAQQHVLQVGVAAHRDVRQPAAATVVGRFVSEVALEGKRGLDEDAFEVNQRAAALTIPAVTVA